MTPVGDALRLSTRRGRSASSGVGEESESSCGRLLKNLLYPDGDIGELATLVGSGGSGFRLS